jgi:hypothetical protein
MTDQPYHNESSQSERREALSNDQAQHSTYFEQAKGSLGQELGRFASLSKGQQVVGATPSVWPRIPSGPWSKPDPTGIEPPTGYLIDAMPAPEGFNPPETGDYPAPAADVEREFLFEQKSAYAPFRRRV